MLKMKNVYNIIMYINYIISVLKKKDKFKRNDEILFRPMLKNILNLLI